TETKIELKSAEEQQIEEVVIESKVSLQDFVVERVDRFAKREDSATVIIDKNLDAAKGREQITQSVAPQVESQPDLANSQGGFRGDTSADKFLNKADQTETLKIKEIVDRVGEAEQPTDLTEQTAPVTTNIQNTEGNKQL